MDAEKTKRIADHIRQGFRERYRPDSTLLRLLAQLSDSELVEKARLFHKEKVEWTSKQTLRVKEARSVLVTR